MFKVAKCIRAFFYVPAHLDVGDMCDILMQLAGGYTLHTTCWGMWKDPEGQRIHGEHVHTYEVVVVGVPYTEVLATCKAALMALFDANPEEKCAMAVVNGRCVTLTRKDN